MIGLNSPHPWAVFALTWNPYSVRCLRPETPTEVSFVKMVEAFPSLCRMKYRTCLIIHLIKIPCGERERAARDGNRMLTSYVSISSVSDVGEGASHARTTWELFTEITGKTIGLVREVGRPCRLNASHSPLTFETTDTTLALVDTVISVYLLCSPIKSLTPFSAYTWNRYVVTGFRPVSVILVSLKKSCGKKTRRMSRAGEAGDRAAERNGTAGTHRVRNVRDGHAAALAEHPVDGVVSTSLLGRRTPRENHRRLVDEVQGEVLRR